MSGTGPVEPVNSSADEGDYEVIGDDGPRLSDRWHALPARARGAALAVAVALGLTAAVLVSRPLTADGDKSPPPPVPWPWNVTEWRYAGLARPLDPHATSGTFRFAVSVDSGPPVGQRVTGAAFTGLTAHATPDPVFTVRAGTTRKIIVEISVSDCSGLPLNADLPFLDVTLRNTRAIQHHSFIFGGAYPRDLSALLHRACPPTNAPPPPRPTGSAGSRNTDREGIPPKRPRVTFTEAPQPARHNKKVTSQHAALPMSTDRA